MQEEKEKKRISNNLIIGSLVFIICVLSILTLIQNRKLKDLNCEECNNNPLAYASKMFKEEYGFEFNGTGTFNHPLTPFVYFNSQGYIFMQHPLNHGQDTNFSKGFGLANYEIVWKRKTQ